MQAGPGLPGEASNANQPKGQVPGGAGGDFAAGISGCVPFNHLWPVVAGGGVMTKDEVLKLARSTGLIDRLTNPEQHYEFTDPKKANAVLMSLCQEAADALAAPVQEPVACECNQGQVCHICDPIIPSKQLAQQEPAFWYYTLVVEGQVVGENFTTVNWDTRVEPFGRYDIDHGGKVTKQPLYTTPPAAQQEHEPENEPFVSLVSVQEPVAWAVVGEGEWGEWVIGQQFETNNPPNHEYWKNRGYLLVPLYATPFAQPAVPDAMTSADIQEHIEYVAGWNDCRQAMLEMMK
jgi:hypothetical protein